jgi:hypothetical protein
MRCARSVRFAKLQPGANLPVAALAFCKPLCNGPLTSHSPQLQQRQQARRRIGDGHDFARPLTRRLGEARNFPLVNLADGYDGLSFGDGGALAIVAPVADLAAGRYNRLVIDPSMG